MGGDHKCPVCQATFTRPQHVARHMRSHTGDRPYKCQYCGDQFARSDLLARHINKCHANEKPQPNASGRRKGSAAASRATTSKQACDQCVQSTLPCDGSNPCSKCVSRKCRCTYVKFHRQTAPTGPGHHPPRSPSSSMSSLSGSIAPPRSSGHFDGFVLPPPSSAPSIPPTFPGSDQVFNTPFTFNPAVFAYPPNWPSQDISQLPLPVVSDSDMAAKYRVQHDLLRRTGPPRLSNSPTTLSPTVYITHQNQPLSNWYPAWGESGTYPPLDDTKPLDGIARSHSLASSEPASFAPDAYGAGLLGSAYRPRKMSLDFSDSSSATSQSVPSSATSSNVHLPLPTNEVYDGAEETQSQAHGPYLSHQRRSSMPTALPPPYSVPSDPSQPPSTHHPHRVGEGSFSSAFGLMSIDDPNVLAGLSSDGLPFFSHLGLGVLPNSPNATPMPTRMQHHAHMHARERGMSLGALPTPGLTKETVDSRELKEMWKTFLKSPLGGSGSGAVDVAGMTMPQSPSGQRRRGRVSSLPSVTPTVEKGHPLMVNGHGHGHGDAARPTVHGHPDDLRSYEAAVNARSAPLKLNLVPRRKRTSVCASPQAEEVSSGASSAVGSGSGTGTGQSHGQGDPQGISRPSSSSSTSSYAQAHPASSQHPSSLHAHSAHSGVIKPPPMQGASISLPLPPMMSMSGIHPPSHAHGHSHSIAFGSRTSLPLGPGSRASSVTSDGTGTGGSGSDGEVFRPSFKRYASQTLVPPSSKRALVERGGEKGVDGRGSSEERKGDERRRNVGGKRGRNVHRNGEEGGGMEGVEAGGSPGARPRPMAALPERAKRV